MIPKIIHQIWVGDQSKRPDDLIQTWIDLNPTWKHCLWTEDNIPQLKNQEQFDAMNELAGKADILRYELLYAHGGFFIDADSECINPLDDFLTDNKAFCCWENEQIRQGLMSNGYLATEKHSPLAKALIARVRQYPVEYIASLPNLTAWKTVGPLLLTQVTNEEAHDIHVYPSHYFIPKHYSGLEYSGDDKIYCNQYWGSTHTIEGKKGMKYGS